MTRAILILVAAAVLTAGPGVAATPVLKGAVTSDFTITVTQNGKRAKTLHAGVYSMVVRDESNIHNFHLFGPGVKKKTTVPFVGRVTWTIKLVPGLYRYQCDAHSHFMHGSFRVT